MTAKGMMANYFARARLFKPLGRTFVSLELRHNYSLDLFERERLFEYNTARGADFRPSDLPHLQTSQSRQGTGRKPPTVDQHSKKKQQGTE